MACGNHSLLALSSNWSQFNTFLFFIIDFHRTDWCSFYCIFVTVFFLLKMFFKSYGFSFHDMNILRKKQQWKVNFCKLLLDFWKPNHKSLQNLKMIVLLQTRVYFSFASASFRFASYQEILEKHEEKNHEKAGESRG